MPLYRDRQQPYIHEGIAANKPLFEMLDSFRTNPPSRWIADPRSRDAFVQLYGEDALRTAFRGLVPENYDPAWVGGTNWQGKVYFDEETAAQAPVPKPGEIVKETPFGPVIIQAADRKLGELTVNEFILLMNQLL